MRSLEVGLTEYGSSPRVRGTGLLDRQPAWHFRFIPACAGNSTRAKPSSSRKPVHPRVCGEQKGERLVPALTNGSSPRVRGTGCTDARHRVLRGFIPACAGNSSTPTVAIRARSVHPRVCGEQRTCCRLNEWPCGSSPRVRGTEYAPSTLTKPYRFIPACAGNSASPRNSSCISTVHPRVCGEQIETNEELDTELGSSPRVRGTVSSML